MKINQGLQNLVLLSVACSLAACGPPPREHADLLAPETLGAFTDPPLLFWTPSRGASTYTVYWHTRPADGACPTDVTDYEAIEGLAPGDAGVDVTGCAQLIADGRNGGFSGPTPEGDCVTFELSAGPWGCGTSLCFDIAAENGDGVSPRFGGAAVAVLAQQIALGC